MFMASMIMLAQVNTFDAPSYFHPGFRGNVSAGASRLVDRGGAWLRTGAGVWPIGKMVFSRRGLSALISYPDSSWWVLVW